MASDVDVCNLALGHIGDEATVSSISPSDGSAQADHCVRFYPIARRQLISIHAWGFATKRVALALLGTNELPDTWAYCYSKPNGALNVISVLSPGNSGSFAAQDPTNPLYGIAARPNDTGAQPYVQETLQNGTEVIFTDVKDATARYTVDVTDTTKFTGLFVPALARLLASYLAGPIIKGDAGMKVSAALLKTFINLELPLATSMDQKGQRVNVYKTATPDAIAARR